jgi:heat shock protein 1/8
LEAAITETISWLDASAEASTEEYSEHQKSLEAIANPIVRSVPFSFSLLFLFSRFVRVSQHCANIFLSSNQMQKVYSANPESAPAGGMPAGGPAGGFPGAGNDEPSVEEVD